MTFWLLVFVAIHGGNAAGASLVATFVNEALCFDSLPAAVQMGFPARQLRCVPVSVAESA